MIRLPHLCVISTMIMRFLRLVKSLIFTPNRKKVSLRFSADRARFIFRMESVESSVVLVSLRRFAAV